jgi:hypothetical protein
MIHGNTLQLHAVRNCGAFELPAAILNSSVRNDALQASSAPASDATFGILPREFFRPRVQCSERNVAGLLSLDSSTTFVSNQILRI